MIEMKGILFRHLDGSQCFGVEITHFLGKALSIGCDDISPLGETALAEEVVVDTLDLLILVCEVRLVW